MTKTVAERGTARRRKANEDPAEENVNGGRTLTRLTRMNAFTMMTATISLTRKKVEAIVVKQQTANENSGKIEIPTGMVLPGTLARR